jgi:hypothetical protein
MSLDMKGWIYKPNPTQKEIEQKGGEMEKNHEDYLKRIGCKSTFMKEIDESNSYYQEVRVSSSIMRKGKYGIEPAYWKAQAREARKELDKSFSKFLLENSFLPDVDDEYHCFVDVALEFYSDNLVKRFREHKALYEAKLQKAEEVLKLYRFIEESKFIQFATYDKSGAFHIK